ncbi:MAG: hypothetical protein HRU26_13360, partial [Psychroserpens sp.]|nr:hypothetical protein [Psychroserpens sp.]
LENPIILNSQAEVDAFPVNYPDCTEVPYGLRIIGSDIVDLSPLSQILEVGEDLSIQSTSLETLAGLENVTQYSENLVLRIFNNAQLADISALSNITNVVVLDISTNPMLSSLTGLDGLIEVGLLTIGQNDLLSDLTGLNSLTTADLSIIENPNLLSLNGIDSLINLDYMDILNNDNLINLQGFADGVQIGYFAVGGNDSLESLNGLEGAESIIELNVGNNPNLTDISSLETIEIAGLSTFNLMSISNNPNLSVCSYAGICDLLDFCEVNPSICNVNIQNNDPGCNSPEEVLAACNAQCPGAPILTFNSQVEIDNFPIFFPNCTTANRLEISGSDIVDLTPLSSITLVNGIRVFDCPILQDLSGLENLTVEFLNDGSSIFEFSNNSVLTSFSQITTSSPSQTAALQVTIENNPLLESLEGMEGIYFIDGEFYITNNDALTDLTGLENYTFCSNPEEFIISDNDGLINLNGLDSVTTYIAIDDNNSLQTLDGMNPDFTGSFHLTDNNALTDISVIDNPNFLGGGTWFTISGNPNISVCNYESV